MIVPEWLIVVGLVMDVVGAGVIAVPDIPKLDRWFRFGKLKIARERMESGGVVRGDLGFREIVDLLEDIVHVEDFNDEDGKFEEVIVNRRGGPCLDAVDIVLYGRSPNNEIGS